MKIPTLPFTVTDWSTIPATRHVGVTGEALWRTLDIGDLRVRLVEYSPGYLADHWCDRGHVLYVLEGELETELRDGRKFTLKPGMSYRILAMPRIVLRRRRARSCSLWIEQDELSPPRTPSSFGDRD
jgi:hypothetical protein